MKVFMVQSCMYPGDLPPSCTDYVQLDCWQHGCWIPQESTIKGNRMTYHHLSKGTIYIFTYSRRSLYFQDQLNSSTVIHGEQLVELVISSRNVSVWGFTELILTTQDIVSWKPTAIWSSCSEFVFTVYFGLSLFIVAKCSEANNHSLWAQNLS